MYQFEIENGKAIFVVMTCYNGDMHKWRLYIDESGDHTYKHMDNPDVRYLGLTGVLIQKKYYDEHAQPELEALKRKFFKYDPDNPPILTRSEIIHRKRWFYVLQDEELNKEWEESLLAFIAGLKGYAYVFTVVIDKNKHLVNYPNRTFDPYVYSLAVLLNRVRGLLVKRGEQADVIAEARGGVEDEQIKQAYVDLITVGSYFGGKGEYYRQAYPEKELTVKRKISNVAGLQIADVIAFGQKVQTILKHKSPFPRQLGAFDERLNIVVNELVNRYGRYFLE